MIKREALTCASSRRDTRILGLFSRLLEIDLLALAGVDPLPGRLGLDEAEGGGEAAAGGVPVLRGVGVDLDEHDGRVLRALREPRLDAAVPQLLLLGDVVDD